MSGSGSQAGPRPRRPGPVAPARTAVGFRAPASCREPWPILAQGVVAERRDAPAARGDQRGRPACLVTQLDQPSATLDQGGISPTTSAWVRYQYSATSTSTAAHPRPGSRSYSRGSGQPDPPTSRATPSRSAPTQRSSRDTASSRSPATTRSKDTGRARGPGPGAPFLTEITPSRPAAGQRGIGLVLGSPWRVRQQLIEARRADSGRIRKLVTKTSAR